MRKSRALAADIAPFGGGLLHFDAVAVAAGHFLDDDGIGAGGITPPVKMRAASPGSDRCGKRPAGRHFADDMKARRRLRDVGGAHRIAVHRRDIRRRLGAQRLEIEASTRPSASSSGTSSGGSGVGLCKHALQRLGDREQRHGIHSSTSRDNGRNGRRSFRRAGCLRCACRARPP